MHLYLMHLTYLMHNIVLHISTYLFPWLYGLCDLSPINNDSHIHIRVFLGH